MICSQEQNMNTDALFEQYIKPHLSSPRKAKDWYVYECHHIDDMAGFLDAEKTFGDKIGIHALFNIIRAQMIIRGWEGDGDLELCWLPPFCLRNSGTIGGIIWHVKQANNGTSYIVSEYRLNSSAVDKDGNISTY
jgi:hypothetical protein